MAAHAQNKYNEGDNQDKRCDNDGNKLKSHVAVREAALVGAHVVAHLVWVALEAPYACAWRKLTIWHKAADALLWNSSNHEQKLMAQRKFVVEKIHDRVANHLRYCSAR